MFTAQLRGRAHFAASSSLKTLTEIWTKEGGGNAGAFPGAQDNPFGICAFSIILALLP